MGEDRTSGEIGRSFVRQAAVTFPNVRVDRAPRLMASLAQVRAAGCHIVRLSAPGVAVDLSGRLARESGLGGWVKIAWQSSGTARIRTATSEARLQGGEMAVLPLDRSYRFEADDRHDALFLILDASERPFWRDMAENWPVQPVSCGSALAAAEAGIASFLRQAVGNEEDALAIEACLDLAARSLRDRVPREATETYPHHRLKTASLLVEANIADRGFDPAALAEAMGRSRRSLYKDFEQLGMTPAQFILAVRLSRARREILTGRACVGGLLRVALDCGFPDGSTFSHAFRRAYGMAPSDLLRGGALRQCTPSTGSMTGSREVSAGKQARTGKARHGEPSAAAPPTIAVPAPERTSGTNREDRDSSIVD